MNISVCIGHGKAQSGGYDSGAVSAGYQEFKLGRAIGKCIGEELSKYNCHVDVINYDADKNLSERIKYVNSKKYDLNMEIHLLKGLPELVLFLPTLHVQFLFFLVSHIFLFHQHRN